MNSGTLRRVRISKIRKSHYRRSRSVSNPKSRDSRLATSTSKMRALARHGGVAGAKERLHRPVPHDDNKTEIVFACDDHELKTFEELKDLWGHTNHERSWQVLFADLAFDALKRHKESAAKAVDMEKVGTPEHMPYRKARARYRNVHVDRLVRNRAGNRCEHLDPVTKERCTCTHALEIDHVMPLALGGLDHPDNMRLLCGPHNRYAAWKLGLRRPGVEFGHDTLN